MPNVGDYYTSDTGNVFEVLSISGEWVRVRQISTGVFCGEVLLWHLSQLIHSPEMKVTVKG
jgi:hypothetical protein